MRFLQSEKSEIVATLARLCLKEKLYIVGRMGKLWLGTPQNIKKITVAFQSKKPVGWCFLYDNSELFPEEPTLGVFVLPNYRGFNLGRVMIERTIENFGKIFIDDRVSYFNKVPILRKKKYEQENSFETSL